MDALKVHTVGMFFVPRGGCAASCRFERRGREGEAETKRWATDVISGPCVPGDPLEPAAPTGQAATLTGRPAALTVSHLFPVAGCVGTKDVFPS